MRREWRRHSAGSRWPLPAPAGSIRMRCPRQRVADVRQEADAACRALDRGALQVGMRATLHGADLLRGVGPEGVARTLIARAEAGMEWAGSPADPLAIQRAERLLYGAWDAVAEAEFGIAIQRAYYACQLLGVPLQ